MISVIVPVYNSCKYLEKCLQSVINQDYSDFELLLIDDGSSDYSPIICDKYAKKYDRVRVLHNPHMGLVAARRCGLEMAHGEFVCWVDSDDWVETRFIKDFYELQQNNNFDVVASGLYYDIGNTMRKEINNIPAGEYKVADILGKVLYSGHFYRYGINPNIVTKFFRTDILREAMKYVDDELTIGEDAAITYTALKFCTNIYITEMSNYHYVQRKDSMTKSIGVDEPKKIDLLIKCLRANVGKINQDFNSAVNIYEKYLKFTRTEELLSEKDGKVLLPFGGLNNGESVIIFGAGGTGQTINRFINKTKCLNVVAWVDKEYMKYQADGLPVQSPESIYNFLNTDNIKIIIAVAYEDVAGQIEDDLCKKGVSLEKVKWLSPDFLKG